MFTLPAHPMTLCQSIKNTFALWRETLISVLPFSVTVGILNSIFPFIQREMPMTQHKGLLMGIAALVAVFAIIPTTGIFAKLGHTAHQQSITLSQAIALSIVKFPALLGWTLMCGLFIAASVGLLYLMLSHVFALVISALIIVFVVATLIVYVLCVFPLIIFENQPVFVAIRKSIALTKNQWWYGGGLMTVVLIFNAVVNVIGVLLLGYLSSVVAACLTLPLQVSMTIIFYEHLKLRANQPTL